MLLTLSLTLLYGNKTWRGNKNPVTSLKTLPPDTKIKKKMNHNPLEKDIEKKVCDYAKSLGILCYKFTSPARRSVPDRLFIMPASKGVFFIEFKRKGGKPTDAQLVEIEKIRKQGIGVSIADSLHGGKCCVDFYML